MAVNVLFIYVALPTKLTTMLLWAGVYITWGTWFTVVPADVDASIYWAHAICVVVYLGTAQLFGMCSYTRMQLGHRRAFSEAKQSLSVKMVIEEQSAEQERLLLSVLPEHVAVQMRQDLGADDSEQFKKIYMSRHENVRCVGGLHFHLKCTETFERVY